MEAISKIARDLKQRYAESDPFRICSEMGIKLQALDMGDPNTGCKGFFMKQSRIRMIVLNSRLSCSTQRIILPHELGHAVLHADKAKECRFHDFQLFDETSQTEYEANIFCAEFLLDDNEVLEQLNNDMSFFQAASTLRVPPELLDFKFRVLKRKGYKLDSPIQSNSRFLGRLEDVRDEWDFEC